MGFFSQDNEWELISSITTVAPVTTISVTGLDGNANGLIRLVIELFLGTGVVATYAVRPNGLAVPAMRSSNILNFGGVPINDIAVGDWRVASGLNTVTRLRGTFLCQAPARAWGRSFTFLGGTGIPSVVWGQIHAFGYWDDILTNITSFDIVSSVAGRILAGSTVKAYKRIGG